ncbi:tRNA pseudouridine(13) synthase TruD [Alteromonas sp. D210916BOD_24]|uniref:tRNA pseudouridine(13) synthase TruD n=1 Tax=Alteromonas sp. D210916BOD_24 TaxID=3157618 RepID=UPI00399D4E87
MKPLHTDHWQYYYAKPVSTGIFKFQAEDFQVVEDLGYEPCGEGEHQFVFIEKINTNTAFVAEQLARFVKLPLRQITYAGRKDKYAVTQQWFGIHAPGKPDFDFSSFDLEGVRVLKQVRHNRKLRTGQLKGNHFTITLRQVLHPEAIEERLQDIAQQGVPNYYGEQRFGVMRLNEMGEVQRGGNLVMAERMVNGETIRHRNKRSMALSALRSWLFNEMLSARLAQGQFDTVLDGDALMLTGSNSFFIHSSGGEKESKEQQDAQHRYDTKDICPSAPLWGKGELPTRATAFSLEQNVANTNSEVIDFLSQCGFEQERRAIKIWPSQLQWQSKGDTFTVSFSLPSGCFATSVLRECVETLSPINRV